MTDDYHESEKEKNNYPRRLLTIFYEDVVTDQIETFRKIYNFAGYDFSAKEQLRLAQTSAFSKKASPSNTYRKDSTRTAHDWRNNINKNVLKETNKACFNLYGVLGYPQLGKPGDVSNSNIPLRMKPYQKRKL
ncbi:Carbohydrate sulfotransferase 2 [Mizuhopecten yessoensis]|uniref:Carbohydrate sulfotransferase 2 n=1 Tax=Mizuhopecten yessoensis TaxID=6573 RepID=A0A210QRG3_MIZYE|nr:Carbohydrate sulfotransferase 2 [Mizuhopecten yessoensis]